MGKGVTNAVSTQDAVRLYLSGMSISQVAHSLGATKSTTRLRLKSEGVLRTPSEGLRNTLNRQSIKRVAHNRADLSGRNFGRLSVSSYAGTNTHNKATWSCNCECGVTVVVDTGALTSGNSKSCGCLAIDSLKARRIHSGIGTKTYRIWQAMLNRCRNKRAPHYNNYGGRGVSVCAEWFEFTSFISDMGECPSGDYSIERVDNEEGYSKQNCKWATRQEQGRNKRNNRLISFNGETMILKDWADRIGIDQASLRERLEKWPLDAALTKPKRGRSL